MSATFAAADALLNYRGNRFNKWNVSQSSSVRGTDPTNASNRVYSGFADVKVAQGSVRFTKSDKVFATCFAVAEAAIEKGSGKPYDKEQREKRWHQAWRVLDRAMPLGKGIIVIAARRLCERANWPGTSFNAVLDSDVRRIVTQLQDVLKLSGQM